MDTLERINSLLDDEKFATVTSLVIALYAGMAAPALPDSVVLFFDTIVGKLLFLFLIGFMASRNIRVALMIAVAFVVTLHVVNQRNTEKYFNFRREGFGGHDESGKNPQEREVNASDFTTNVDEHFSDHPLAEDITPKDTFGGHDEDEPEEGHEDEPEEGHEDEPEDYITPKDTFANMEDEPEDYITPKDTFTGDMEVVPEEGHEDEPEDYITPKDTFRNYRIERFNDDDEDAPTEGPGSKEHMDPEMEDVDGFQPNVEEAHEDEPEEAHEDEPEEDEDEPEGFYSNINPSARNFGVNPANNTSGRTGNMYARVRFH